MKALFIIPLVDGFIVSERGIPGTIDSDNVISIQKEMGSAYLYSSDKNSLLGFIKDYLEAQAKANPPPETP